MLNILDLYPLWNFVCAYLTCLWVSYSGCFPLFIINCGLVKQHFLH